jgi:hypothetical protein
MRGRCIQFLIGVLIFSVVLTIAGFVASYSTGRRMAAFASDGHTVSGTVTGKRANTVAREQTYWLYVHTDSQYRVYWVDVRFRTQDGEFHNGSASVAEALYEGLLVDGQVKVTYVGSNPDLFYLGNVAPVDPDVTTFSRMFAYGITASLLLVIAIAVAAFWDSGSGTTASKPQAFGGLRRLQRFSSRVPRQRISALRTGHS